MAPRVFHVVDADTRTKALRRVYRSVTTAFEVGYRYADTHSGRDFVITDQDGMPVARNYVGVPAPSTVKYRVWAWCRGDGGHWEQRRTYATEQEAATAVMAIEYGGMAATYEPVR